MKSQFFIAGVVAILAVFALLVFVKSRYHSSHTQHLVASNAADMASGSAVTTFRVLEAETRSDSVISKSLADLEAQYTQASVSSDKLKQFQPILATAHTQIIATFQEPKKSRLDKDFVKLEGFINDQTSALQVKETTS